MGKDVGRLLWKPTPIRRASSLQRQGGTQVSCGVGAKTLVNRLCGPRDVMGAKGADRARGDL